MKKLSKLLIAFIALINLSACMTTQEAAAKYDAMSSQDLCMAYISNENYNIWQPDRLASIQRRGLDCRPYLAAGMRKKNASRAFEAALGAAAAGSQTTVPTGTSLSTGFTKVCYYNGVGGQSAITVASTSICPVTNSSNVSGFTKVCNYPNAMGGPKALTVSSTSICPVKYN
tara:strand:- start:52 stop:567 length:516 start_codon:yes stop_codon:yes gene_type:complete